MTVDQYEQLGWSPTTWALLQLGMVLFTVAVIGLFVWMVHRAGQATAPVRAREAEPVPGLAVPDGPKAVAALEAVRETPPEAPAVSLPRVEPQLTHV